MSEDADGPEISATGKTRPAMNQVRAFFSFSFKSLLNFFTYEAY